MLKYVKKSFPEKGYQKSATTPSELEEIKQEPNISDLGLE